MASAEAAGGGPAPGGGEGGVEGRGEAREVAVVEVADVHMCIVCMELLVQPVVFPCCPRAPPMCMHCCRRLAEESEGNCICCRRRIVGMWCVFR